MNYDVPIHADDYVHRIGRTGRAGRTGTALTIVSRADGKYIDAVTSLIKKEIPYDGPTLEEFVPSSSEDESERPRRGGEGRGRRGERRDDERREGRPEGRRSRDRGDRPPREASSDDRAPAAQDEARPARTPRPERAAQPVAPSGAPRHAQRDDDGPSVKGLGDHMPSFLMKPVRRKSA